MNYAKGLALLPVVLMASLSGCEVGPKSKTQMGPDGAGMNQITANSRIDRSAYYIPPPPYPLEPDNGGPRAGETYENVQIVGDISTDEFNRLMLSMNEWIGTGEQGCNYCHNPENMASDEVYTKVVARKMLAMTRNINTNWKSHVQNVGVTCWTCHRGNAVPKYNWSNMKPDPVNLMGRKNYQNTPVVATGFASLPHNIYEPYLVNTPGGNQNIRVGAIGNADAYRTTPQGQAIQTAEQTYGLMMRVSTALNVNCTYCHNANNFASWKQSTPQRVTAWYGIRMVRDINSNYINPLQPVFPAKRLGAMGDPYKANCMTCHQGVNKPMGGVSMLQDHPALGGPRGSAALIPAVATTAMAPAPDPNATAASCNADFSKALAGKTIEFDTGAATIRSVSTPLLDTLVQIAGRCSNFKMQVAGHTDATGNPAANMKLSKDRALAVDKYLIAKGVSASQISAEGFGSGKPVDTSGTPAGNQRNRRIEITVAGKSA